MTELLVLAASFALLWELRTIELVLRRIEELLEHEEWTAIAGFTELPTEDELEEEARARPSRSGPSKSSL